MSMANAAIALQIGGAASNAMGSYYQAKNTQAKLKFDAEMADINAQLSETAAQSALFRGQRVEQGVRLRTGNLKSAQRARMAANGVDLGVGNAAEVLTTTDVMGEIDANQAQANAISEAWGYRIQGTNAKAQAAVGRAGAAGINPSGAMFNSLMGDAGSVATSWYKFDKAGAWG